MLAEGSGTPSLQQDQRVEGWRQGQNNGTEKSGDRAMISEGWELIEEEHPCLFMSETISRIDKQQYIITPQLLLGTAISEFKRAVLRFWIYEQSSKLKIDRNTVASANCLVDLFLQKGGDISIEDFQVLGIASLLLVNKCSSREIKISIDERVFPRRLLNEFEAKICKRLNFRLNPTTYVQILDELICAWNSFAENHSDLWCYKNTNTIRKDGRVFSCRHIYEMLDTLFMVVKTYSYNQFDLTLEVFRIFLLKDYQVVSCLPKSIEDEVIISFWQNPEDNPLMGSSFDSIFHHFYTLVQPYGSQSSQKHVELTLNHEIEAYVNSFLRAGFQSVITRETIKISESQLQTFNSVSLKVARNFIPLKKNYRKSSGETLAI